MTYSPTTANVDLNEGALDKIDAYMHIGTPRFGSVRNIFHTLDTYRISRAVVVLGPLVPDLESLFQAMRERPDRIRGVGIPFGADAEQRLELTRTQVEAGVIGMRLSYEECLATPGIMELLGDQGRCIYALNPVGSSEAAEFYLAWLSRYPDSFIAAPHFLNTSFSWRERNKLDSSCLELLQHPRFYAILSRQGGNGTTEPYPHPDYLTWVEFVIAHCGWDRIVWGSEFPVYLWRNETYSQCASWLSDLLPGTVYPRLQAFWSGNAQRLLFETPAPPTGNVAIPEWLQSQFAGIRNRTVPLIQNTTLDLPGDLYYRLLERYLESEDFAAERPFNEFFKSLLGALLKENY
ncbi:Predicted metal-dependent hydrolase, TIM-barrel fold [Paenibacillus sp. 1_12]|uniref:hypothetical protein n=1 Tax=Paenibacillus sp. 1_12 TaxID=1566278 RepID=UPI0008E22767|nr:hypothetical protein [Paenibacillus sp. 1_12]SFK99495.1 Predicted metal-dependent hydrolase, TIM-barrel fold [Paenibacillus sp. 1_12]